MHEVHDDTLSCQVCHSVAYINCDSCHVAISEQTGNPFFETSADYLTFLIGRNPIQSEDRPYEFVPVRHVPVDPDSFAFYGDNLLPNFDDQPTWRYTTPHNIQRETPQTESCSSCHGNEELFLTSVIIETIPVESLILGSNSDN
jgi:thiosulfate/3-mercaptopyruvate sulfurtransferase